MVWFWLANLVSKREQKAVYDRLIKTSDFQIFLHGLMKTYKFNTVPDPSDALYMSFRNGQRSVIQGILDVLDKNVVEFSDAIPDFEKKGEVRT